MRHLKPILLILLGCSLLLSLFSFNYMRQHQFWGDVPLAAILSAWMSLNLAWAFYQMKQKTQFIYQLCSILSGLLLGQAFVYTSPLLFIGFLPLLYLKQELERPGSSTKMSSHWAYAFNAFMVWNIYATYWVANAALIPALVAFSINSLFMTVPWTAAIYFERKFPQLKAYSLVFFWISFEWIHQHWEISWPWLNLGNGFAFYKQWIQWYDWTGIFGGSLWVLLVNLILIQSVQNKRFVKSKLILACLLILLPIGIGIYKYHNIHLEGTPLKIGIVQPNYEPHYEKFEIDQREQMLRFEKLSQQILSSDLSYLIWPETSFEYISTDEFDDDWRIQRMKLLLRNQSDLCLVAGLSTLKSFKPGEELTDAARENKREGFPRFYEIQNSAVQVKSDSTPIPVYVKSKLVPGVETFPYRNFLPFLKPIVDQLGGSVHGLGKQKERSVFINDSVSIAPVICYESIYGNYIGDYIRKGAQAIFIMTNDGWWDQTPGHIQHLAFGALRAIEFRRPIARCANTGISCFINARGDVLQSLEYGKQGSISGTLNLSTQRTVYQQTGDLIASMCLIASVLALFFMFTKFLQARFSKNQSL